MFESQVHGDTACLASVPKSHFAVAPLPLSRVPARPPRCKPDATAAACPDHITSYRHLQLHSCYQVRAALGALAFGHRNRPCLDKEQLTDGMGHFEARFYLAATARLCQATQGCAVAGPAQGQRVRASDCSLEFSMQVSADHSLSSSHSY